MAEDKEDLMDAHEWAEKVAKRIKEGREKADLEARQRLRDAVMKKAHGSEVWRKVKGAVKQRVVELNKVLAQEVIFVSEPGMDVIEVQLKTFIYYTLKFDRLKGELNCGWHNIETQYMLRVVNSDDVSFCDKGGISCTPDQVAEQILDEALSQLDRLEIRGNPLPV